MPSPIPAAFDWPGQRVVLENERCLFLQMPQPVLVGSGIIVPRALRPTLFDLTADEWEATYRLLHEVKDQLDRLHRPDGYTVGWNVGTVGGQEVMHAHLHIIPRFADEPLAGQGLRYAIKQEANRRLG